MAKVKNPIIENSKEIPIVYSERTVGDGYTHNARSKGLKKKDRKIKSKDNKK